MTSGAWPSGPHNVLPVPAIEKSPRIAVFKRFSGGFPVQPSRCPPRHAAADVRPPVASGHKKRRRPPSTPSRSMNVRMCGPFPPEICPFPLKNGGFPTLPPVLPVYPGFSIILSPYTAAPTRRRAFHAQIIICHTSYVNNILIIAYFFVYLNKFVYLILFVMPGLFLFLRLSMSNRTKYIPSN